MFQSWYFGQPPWDTGISPPELIEFIQNNKPGRALDIGCGTGTNVITLAQAGWRVTGIDFAPRAIKIAKQKIKAQNIQAELSVNDATNLQGINNTFNLILDIGCFHSIPKTGQAKYLDQLDRILASNGFWLMYTFLNPGTPQTTLGLAASDISLISTRLNLISRNDGTDQRERPSAWFLFQKQV